MKVNELIIKKLNEKYKNINWGILSEESVKISNQEKLPMPIGCGFLTPRRHKRFYTGVHKIMHVELAPAKIVLIPERKELWISDGKVMV